MEMTDSFHHRFQLYSQEVGGDLEVPETQHQTSFNTSCIKSEISREEDSTSTFILLAIKEHHKPRTPLCSNRKTTSEGQ
jgi:hypothetical protein